MPANRSRVNIDGSQDLASKIRNVMPHGDRGKFLVKIIETAVAQLEAITDYDERQKLFYRVLAGDKAFMLVDKEKD